MSYILQCNILQMVLQKIILNINLTLFLYEKNMNRSWYHNNEWPLWLPIKLTGKSPNQNYYYVIKYKYLAIDTIGR